MEPENAMINFLLEEIKASRELQKKRRQQS